MPAPRAGRDRTGEAGRQVRSPQLARVGMLAKVTDHHGAVTVIGARGHRGHSQEEECGHIPTVAVLGETNKKKQRHSKISGSSHHLPRWKVGQGCAHRQRGD